MCAAEHATMNNDSTDMGGDVTKLSGTVFAICFLMDNVQHLTLRGDYSVAAAAAFTIRTSAK